MDAGWPPNAGEHALHARPELMPRAGSFSNGPFVRGSGHVAKGFLDPVQIPLCTKLDRPVMRCDFRQAPPRVGDGVE